MCYFAFFSCRKMQFLYLYMVLKTVVVCLLNAKRTAAILKIGLFVNARRFCTDIGFFKVRIKCLLSRGLIIQQSDRLLQL